MGKRFVRCLALAAFAALLTITWVTGATAQVTNISTCQTLTIFGHTYRLTTDLVACGDCLIVANNRITVDLQGHKISQGVGCGPAGAGVTDSGTARDQTIVKNGEISSGAAAADKFVYGINLEASTRTELRNIYSHHHALDGMRVGTQSLVAGLPNVTPKTCRALFNGDKGIVAEDVSTETGRDRVQVQNCEASNNVEEGIEVGDHCLITRNIANSNGGTGIETGAFCDVTFNTANSNESGIEVGSNSLATGNTTNNNVDEGLEVECPGTVTNNNSSGNGALNYEFEEPPNCFKNNNN